MLRSKQRFTDAIAAYDRAIARIATPAPNDWLLFYDRGICYERSHQWPKAEADFQHALELAPDQPFVLNYLGYSWADMGQNLTAGPADDREGGRSSGRTTARSSTAWAGCCCARATPPRRSRRWNVRSSWSRRMPPINGHLGDAYWPPGASWRRRTSGAAR